MCTTEQILQLCLLCRRNSAKLETSSFLGSIKAGSHGEASLCFSSNESNPSASAQFITVDDAESFVLGKSTVEPLSPSLIQKTCVLNRYLSSEQLTSRRVLVFGLDAAFFSLHCQFLGAADVLAITNDEKALESLSTAKHFLSTPVPQTSRGNVSTCCTTADVVIAFGVVENCYSSEGNFDSLDSIIEKLAQLTEYFAIIDFALPGDQQHENSKMNFRKKVFQLEPYSREAFETALSKHYCRWELIGHATPTRPVYAVFKTEFRLDLDAPMPLLFEPTALVSSRSLCTIGGVDIWSRVYDTGNNCILKQASFDLAAREARIMSLMPPGTTPKVLSVEQHESWSAFLMEKIEGIRVDKAATELDCPESYFQFCRSLLDLLKTMEGLGIKHNNLLLEDVYIANGRPLLADFAWAQTRDLESWIPQALHQQLPEASPPSDVFSAGMILKHLNGFRFSTFFPLIELMCEPDPQLRVNDINVLIDVCDYCYDKAQLKASSTDKQAYLIEKLGTYAQRLSALQLRQQVLAEQYNLQKQRLLDSQNSPRAFLAHAQKQEIESLKKELHGLRSSSAFRLASIISRTRQVLAPEGSARHDFVVRLLGKLGLK